jgi:hypothetical protein
MQYHDSSDDWVILYESEAAHIGLAVPPNQIPEKLSPVVIASIYIDHETSMLMDVRSIERAEKIIQWVDKHLPRRVAKITDAAIYNQLITADPNAPEKSEVDFDVVFNPNHMTVVDSGALFREAQVIAMQYEDKKERMQALLNRLEENSKKQLPTVEKLPVHYYEDGIESFKSACQMRQIIAMQHYLGNENYSFYDVEQKLSKSNLSKL